MTAKVCKHNIPYGEWPDGVPKKGTWHGGKKADGSRTATMSCPGCVKIASLSGHEILDDGAVRPSVVCPNNDCNFHEWIKLVGWSD